MINFLDIGCAADFDTRWSDLAPALNYVVFDPDEEECERLSAVPAAPFASHRYFPIAITPETKEYPLFVASQASCSSLLEPNTSFLNRFLFDHLFEIVGKENIQGISVRDAYPKIGFQPDVLKMDVQGLEIQILKSAPEFFVNTLAVDLDVGFTRNYQGEAVFWEISNWMEENGFLLMDLRLNRVRRKAGNEHLDPLQDFINIDTETSISQPLWGHSIWMKDLMVDGEKFDREQFDKAAQLADHLGFTDFKNELLATAERLHAN